MMISVLDAQYAGGMMLDVTFSDGCRGRFDLGAYLSSHAGPLLDALKDETAAGRVFVDAGALAWPNGLELSPARVRELALILKAAA